jgi:hypothetical protein
MQMYYGKWLFLTSILLLLSGCGQTEQGTPLGHHPKDLQQMDFDIDRLSWRVDNGEGLRMSIEGDYLYLQFDHSAGESDAQNIQFIIDVDNNTSTGNAVENGADYIVENGYLYRSQKRDLWDWKEVGKMEAAVDVENHIDCVRIPLTMLENMQPRFGVNAELLNSSWKPVLYSPSATDANGNHLKTHYLPQ